MRTKTPDYSSISIAYIYLELLEVGDLVLISSLLHFKKPDVLEKKDDIFIFDVFTTSRSGKLLCPGFAI